MRRIFCLAFVCLFFLISCHSVKPERVEPEKVLPPKILSVPDMPPSFTNPLGMEFAYIPPGTFTQGSPKEEPGRIEGEDLHQTTLTKGFYMMTTPVTQRHWEQLMGTYPSFFSACGLECPVENISWHDKQDFIRALNTIDPTRRYRLPTEAQWEYAARAGTTTAFHFGDCITTDQVNYDGRYPLREKRNYFFVNVCPIGEFRQTTTQVKSFPPNAFGLYDMHGNVMEACQDWYEEYTSDPVVDPQGPEMGLRRVYRGGAWNSDGKLVRSASRGRYMPEQWSPQRGFRLVAELNDVELDIENLAKGKDLDKMPGREAAKEAQE
ncbi:MAG: formylglycine-generating enzyme family protein [Desulfatibacillaceae bacterium]|nr:formylglycine-generating enzyme family protein [Desulfatibacillaceae bacterium]